MREFNNNNSSFFNYVFILKTKKKLLIKFYVGPTKKKGLRATEKQKKKNIYKKNVRIKKKEKVNFFCC